MGILDINKAARILDSSGVVAFPTETVYGLGAVATDASAILKVFKAKNRPSDNPLIVHFHSIQQIEEYNINLTPIAREIFNTFSPGPISVLLKLPTNSPLSAATAGQTTIICRIPNHPTALELIKVLNKPIVGPSANLSGRPSSTNSQMVLNQFKDTIDGVIDGGDCLIGIESTIIDATKENELQILRPGLIGNDELIKLVSNFTEIRITSPINLKVVTPGAKYPHYSPKTRVLKISDLSQIDLKSDYAIITTEEKVKTLNLRHFSDKNIHIISLGSKTALNQISHSLYSNLNQIDNLKIRTAYLLEDTFDKSSLAIALENRIGKVGAN